MHVRESWEGEVQQVAERQLVSSGVMAERLRNVARSGQVPDGNKDCDQSDSR